MDKEEVLSLEQFLESQKINNWDFIIMGDGSGSNWNREAGWASVSIEKMTMERLVWWGGLNRGTVNVAEIMAPATPLMWFLAREKERREKHKTRYRGYQVHIFTDSEYCKTMGSARYRSDGIKNGILWRIVDEVQANGFMLHWHWLPRNKVALHAYCDQLSKLARLLLKKYNLQEKLEADVSTSDVSQTVYDINPSSAG